MPFVPRCCVGGDEAYDELLQVGRIGLWQAVLHFDAQRGVAFSTYAAVAVQRQMWQAVAQAEHAGVPRGCPAPANPVEGAEERMWLSLVHAALHEARGASSGASVAGAGGGLQIRRAAPA